MKLTKGCGIKASRVQRHDYGWLLSYDDTKYESSFSSPLESSSSMCYGTVDRWIEKSDTTVPSLQSLCLKAVAKTLPAYVDEWGQRETHTALSWLSAPTLAALSALCSTSGSLTDDITSVVGAHKHVKRLALHGRTEDNASHCVLNDGSRGVNSLTDKGILSVVTVGADDHPVTDSSRHRRRLNVPIISDEEERATTAIKSLSLTDVEHHKERCLVHYNLERLEIANTSLSLDTLTLLCKRCPYLTHLSLSNCTILLEAPHVNNLSAVAQLLFLDPEQGIASLSNLTVLDVSHCDWMNDSILFSFLRGRGGGREGTNKKILPSLIYVNVAGCPGVSELACLHLNQTLQGKPLISTEVKRCHT